MDFSGFNLGENIPRKWECEVKRGVPHFERGIVLGFPVALMHSRFATFQTFGEKEYCVAVASPEAEESGTDFLEYEERQRRGLSSCAAYRSRHEACPIEVEIFVCGDGGENCSGTTSSGTVQMPLRPFKSTHNRHCEAPRGVEMSVC